eukprot:6196259-Pleurochrysis_carterae.AAC.1
MPLLQLFSSLRRSPLVSRGLKLPPSRSPAPCAVSPLTTCRLALSPSQTPPDARAISRRGGA